MRTQGAHYPFTLIVKMPEKWLSSTWEKSDKDNLRIVSKPHAYVQMMSKTPLKFQKNQYKTVGGDVHTRYTLSIHFVKMPEKWPSSTCGKSYKII